MPLRPDPWHDPPALASTPRGLPTSVSSDSHRAGEPLPPNMCQPCIFSPRCWDAPAYNTVDPVPASSAVAQKRLGRDPSCLRICAFQSHPFFSSWRLPSPDGSTVAARPHVLPHTPHSMSRSPRSHNNLPSSSTPPRKYNNSIKLVDFNTHCVIYAGDLPPSVVRCTRASCLVHTLSRFAWAPVGASRYVCKRTLNR